MSDSGTFASILEYYLMIVGSLAVALVLAILGFFLSSWFFIGTGLVLFIVFVYLPLSRTAKKLDNELKMTR
jgi:H+/gluconate symporter-like permease